MSYVKRFYLKNTVMDWHPKNVMYVPSYPSTMWIASHSTKAQAHRAVPCYQDHQQPYSR